MNNKLYHSFCAFSYKGGELCSNINQTIEDIAADKLYPGNTYAFDSYSDSEIYTINDEGKLVEVNIVEEPGFIEAFKKALRKDAEWADEWKKNHKNEE